MIGSDGRTRYCGVWGRPPGAAITGQTYRDQFEGNFEQNQANLSDQLLLDVAVSGASKPQPTRERAQADLQSKGNDAGPGQIRDDPAFAEIAKAAHADRRYAAVWSRDASFEAISIYGVDPVAQVSRSRELIALGYRPVSWSVTRTTPEGTPASRLGLAPARGQGASQGPTGKAASKGRGRLGSAGPGRGGLASPAAQRRPAAAQFHHQLAESAGADPRVMASRARATGFPRSPRGAGRGWPTAG